MSSGLYSIDKLDDDNYDSWIVQMRAVLVHCDLWSYVSGTTAEPDENDGAGVLTWKAKDEKALATILL